MKVSDQLAVTISLSLGTRITVQSWWLQYCEIRVLLLLLVIILLPNCELACEALGTKPANSVDEWLNHGGNLQNQRYAQFENNISVNSVSELRIKWKAFIGASVSATASISGGYLYFPDWEGSLYALAEDTGMIVWAKNLTQLTSSATTVISRTTPAVAGEFLLLGLLNPATILAVRRLDGSLVWSTQLDKHPNAQITMSGTAYNGSFYVGVSSAEEGVNSSLCCTFQGSFQKLDVATGKILWKTLMVPDNSGVKGRYAGAAIWGSSPAIDVGRNLIYIATGNNYQVPPSVEECENIQNNLTHRVVPDPCLIPDNHAESALALDLDTGIVKWSTHLGGYDAYTMSCRSQPTNPNCPEILGSDYDFAECPMLISVASANGSRDIAVTAQKSGVVWALDRDTGKVVWSTVAGPGSRGGGAMWGAATDGSMVYTNEANSFQMNFTLVPSTNITTGGAWVAMEASTGRILWSTASPDDVSPVDAPVTIANGLLLAGSFDKNFEGKVYALDSRTGQIVWNATTEATVYGGFSVSNGCAFIGNGYRRKNTTGGRYFYAFCVQ